MPAPERPTARERRLAALAIGIVAAAALLRAWIAAASYRLYLPANQPDEGYFEQGVCWLSTHMFRSGFRGPLYVAFNAAVEAPFSPADPGRVRAALAAASTAVTAGALSLGAAPGAALAGLLAAAALAFSAVHLGSLLSLNIHAFYGLMLAALALGAAQWARKPSPAGTALLGAACGASLLCRSAHLPLPFLLALYAAWRGSWRAAAWRRGALLLACAAAAASPWAIRNLVLERRWYPLDLDAGAVNLFAASRNHDEAMPVEDAFALAAQEPDFAPMAARSGPFPALRSLAERRIRAHPIRYAGGAARRAFLLWGPFAWILALGLFGLWRRRDDPASHALALVLASLAFYSAVSFDLAYRDGLAPLAAILGGWGAASLPLGMTRDWPAWPKRPASLLILAAAPFVLAYAWMLVLFAEDFDGSPADGRYDALITAAAARDNGSADPLVYARRLSTLSKVDACRVLAVESCRPGPRRGDLAGLASSLQCVRVLFDARSLTPDAATCLADGANRGRAESLALAAKELGNPGLAVRAEREASAALARAGQGFETRGRLLAARAEARDVLGDTAGSCSDARQADILTPGNTEALELVAGCQAARGDVPEAYGTLRALRPRISADEAEMLEQRLFPAIIAAPDRGRVESGLSLILSRDPSSTWALALRSALSESEGKLPDAEGWARLWRARAATARDIASADRRLAVLATADKKERGADQSAPLAAAVIRLHASETEGRLEEAFAQALALEKASPAGSPNALQARIESARLALRLGRLDQCARLTEEALDQPTIPASTRATLLEIGAAASMGMGRQAEAQSLLLRAVEASAQQACSPGLEGVDPARIDAPFFDACLKERPMDAGLWLDRGVARFNRGDPTGAAADLRRALTLDPGLLEAAVSLAVLARPGQRGQALALLEEALRRSAGRSPAALVEQARQEENRLRADGNGNMLQYGSPRR